MATPVYEFESEGLPELEEEAHESAHEMHEVSPVRKIYADAMMEHLAHESAQAESEHEAAEHFLPLIPLVASKLLPLAAKAIPKIARVLPKVTRAVNRVTPQLTRGVSRITRTLFRNPRTRPLVRTIPSIARRTVANIARQAATGQTVTPRTAVRTLAQQARMILRSPRHRSLALRRSRILDRQAHRLGGLRAPAPDVVVNVNRSCCRACGRLR